MRQQFDLLRTHCPVLFHVVCGAMGLGERELEVSRHPCSSVSVLFDFFIQEPSYNLAGGTRAAVRLVEPITQIIAQIQKIAHPSSRAMLSIVNGVYGAAKHLDGDLFKLGSTSGTMVSKKSALRVIDSCTSGKNKVKKYQN